MQFISLQLFFTFILLENPLSFDYDTRESFIASVNKEL